MAQINKKLIVEALRRRIDPRYEKGLSYGGYNYDGPGGIYFWARRYFPDYNRLYKTNEEFTKYFVRDLNNKAPRLIASINAETKLAEEQTPVTQAGQETTQQPVAAGVGAGESAATMQSGGKAILPHLPSPLIPNTPPVQKTKMWKDVEESLEKAGVPKEEPGLGKPLSETETQPAHGTIPLPPKPLTSTTQAAVTPGKRSFQLPKIPTGISSGISSLGSSAGTSFYRNIGSKVSLNSMSTGMLNLISKVGGSGLGTMGGVGSRPGIPSGGIFGSVRRVFPRRNGVGNFAGRFNQAPASKKSSLFPRKRILFGALGIFMLMFVGVTISGIQNQQTPTAEAGPISSTGVKGLDYTLALRDSTIVPNDIRDQIKAAFPNAKLESWDLIIQKSKDSGWNPALVLALWIEESGAQGAASYTDALGCAPLQPTTDINISLSCLFNNFSSFTNDQFPQFMAKYSGGGVTNPFANNPNFPANLKVWYSKLVPTGIGVIIAIVSSIGSCPAVGEFSTPYGYNIPDYPSVANEGCGNLPSCHNGIDIAAPIGTPVKSTLDGVVTTIDSSPLRGSYIIITDPTGLDITLEHLNTITVSPNANVTKGQVVGTIGLQGEGSTGPHLHYKIRKSGVVINPLRTLGNSASLPSYVLTLSDDIGQNNYASSGHPSNWGRCNQ